MDDYALWAMFTLALYFADVVTDVLLLVQLAGEKDQLVMAALVGGALALHTIAMCIYDMVAVGGLRWKGVFLNLTYLRLPYVILSPKLRGIATVDAKRSGEDIKLLEALLESTPQLYIQTVLLFQSEAVSVHVRRWSFLYRLRLLTPGSCSRYPCCPLL
jgi:hypothetical protein